MKLFKRKSVLAKVFEKKVKKNKVVKNTGRVTKNVSGAGNIWFLAILAAFMMGRRTWRKQIEKNEERQIKKCRKIAEKRAKEARKEAARVV